MKHKLALFLSLFAFLFISCIENKVLPKEKSTGAHNANLINSLKKLASTTGFKVYTQNPVITIGPKSSWDAGALGSMTVLKVGNTFHLYYEAWGVRSEKKWDAEEYESLQIGHATSTDGIHWTKDPANPVLPRGAQGEWDRTGTWDPFVLHEAGLYKMWYGGGGGGKPCDWAYAVSKDGAHFEKKGKLSNLGGVEDCHVVHDTDTGLYHMYYWDREHEPTALFCVTSRTETGFDFDKPVNIRIDGEKYPEMYKFTHVLKDRDGWHMFYADFERPHCPDSFTRYATSTDGIHWQARNKKLLEGHDAEILKAADDLYLMYYGPRNHFDAKDCDIRLAIYNGRLPDLVFSEGDILWQHTVGENIEATTTIDDEGNIYTTGGGYIWSFTKDGKLRWKTCPLDEGPKGLNQEYPYPLSVASSPAVSPDGKKVYITGYAGVFAFRTSDGKLLWKKTVFDNYYEFSTKNFEDQVMMWKKTASKDYPKIFATTPAISADGTRLYAGAGDNDFSSDSFYCIDTKDGSVIWEYVMPHPPQQVEEGKYTRGYLGGASLGPDGTVYIASMHGWLVSLTDNGNSYTENWAYNVGAEMRMPPSMDAEGFLYVGSSSAGGYIHKVDSRTGKKAPGNWPVKTKASEVFANIAIASDGTIYANSEDHRLWAFNPDGTVKWNNLEFEHWGGDPLIRADDRIIVTSQLNKAARVVCVRDDGDKGVTEWFSEPITKELAYNETNVNIAPNGDIYVTSGVESPHALFAIKGNGLGLSTTSPWPKYMGNIQNNGSAQSVPKTTAAKEGDILWQKNDLGENLESAPAVDSAGNVYVIGNGIVYSYTSGGTFRWSTTISWGDADTPSVSPDNSVVYASGTSGVYALNTSNGNQIWHSPIGEFHTVPCVSADGSRVYIPSGDLGGSGTIYALNASDGSTAWSYHPSRAGGFMGGASLDTHGNIYVPGQNAILYSLKDNGNSYSVNWTFNLGAEARQPVTVGGDGYIYATSNTGVVHKINASTGNEDTSGSWPALGGIGEVFASMCFGPDGTLYVNAEDYKLHALNPDGSEKWTFEFDMWGSDPLVRDDGKIIVMGQVDGAARVCCLTDNGSSATLEWISDPICSTLHLNETNVNIGPDGTIYVHSGDQSPLGLFAIKGNDLGLSKTSPWPKYMGNIQNNGSAANQVGFGKQDLSSDKNQAYNEFFRRVQEEESYIGFFAAEKKCISKVDEAYKKARRRFFLGVRVSDEEVGEYMEEFIEFCKENDYLNNGCEEQWQKTLTVLSYELYANMPIFEFSADNIIEHRNLIFAEYPNKKLALDLFLPEEPLDKPVPCVVCIHGGGWRVNRRLWFEPFAKYIASNGMAAVTIDYRMLPAVEIIDCVYDTKAAVRWVRANADKFGIDPDRIGALGASAGAHLISLLATTANVPELEGTGGNPGVSTAVQAVVGFATPAFKIKPESSRRAKRFGLNAEDMKLISPYENISAGSAPLYLVHGTKDKTVNPQDSQDLYDRYKEVGAHVELKWIPDKGHDFYEGTDLGIELATEFFKEQFGLER